MLRGTRAELLAIVCSVALVLGSLGDAPVARAASGATDPAERQAQINRELERLRGEFGEAVADERQALAEYTVSQQEKARLDAEVIRLDEAITSSQTELALAQQRLADAQEVAVELEAELAATEGRLEGARQDARDQVVAAYVSNEVGVYHALILLSHADGPRVTGASYAQAVADHQDEVVGTYLEEWNRGQAQRDAALAAREHASSEADLVAQREAELQASRAEQAAAVASAAAEVAHQRQLLRQVQATKGTYQTRINALEKESAEVAALLQRRQAGQGRFAGTLQYPLPGYRIGSNFGYRRHPIFGDVRLHAGIDISAPTGTPVKAAAAGEVVASRDCGGYGTCVIIDHGGSLATLSAHLSSTKVRLGDKVSKGQIIGAVGSTGFATGPHLHFEVRINGAPVDPMAYL